MDYLEDLRDEPMMYASQKIQIKINQIVDRVNLLDTALTFIKHNIQTN